MAAVVLGEVALVIVKQFVLEDRHQPVGQGGIGRAAQVVTDVEADARVPARGRPPVEPRLPVAQDEAEPLRILAAVVRRPRFGPGEAPHVRLDAERLDDLRDEHAFNVIRHFCPAQARRLLRCAVLVGEHITIVSHQFVRGRTVGHLLDLRQPNDHLILHQEGIVGFGQRTGHGPTGEGDAIAEVTGRCGNHIRARCHGRLKFDDEFNYVTTGCCPRIGDPHRFAPHRDAKSSAIVQIRIAMLRLNRQRHREATPWHFDAGNLHGQRALMCCGQRPIAVQHQVRNLRGLGSHAVNRLTVLRLELEGRTGSRDHINNGCANLVCRNVPH